MYLPFSISAPVFVGGLVRWLVDRWGPQPDPSVNAETASETSPGALLSTGYIAGGAIGGVLIASCSSATALHDALSRFGVRVLGWFGVSPAVAKGNWLRAGRLRGAGGGDGPGRHGLDHETETIAR